MLDAHGWVGPGTAWAVALALSALVAWESVYARWAPYFLIYAALAIAIPLWAGTCVFGPPGEAFRAHPGAIALAGAGMAAWEIGVFHWLYEVVWLRRRGAADDPSRSLPAAVRSLLAKAEERTGIGPDRGESIFAAYTLLWAPVGEELFYWGFLFAVTRPAWGFPVSALGVSALFAFRHAVHFLFLKRATPWVPAAVLSASAFGSGLWNCWLYERIGSLWPLIALHVAMNLAWIASLLASGHGGRGRRPRA